MPQTQFLLEFPIIPLDAPAHLAHDHQALERRVFRQRAQDVLRFPVRDIPNTLTKRSRYPSSSASIDVISQQISSNQRHCSSILETQ